MSRLVGALLRLYPRDFRLRYGAELREAFESSVRIGGTGRFGPGLALATAVFDLIRGAVAQWAVHARASVAGGATPGLSLGRAFIGAGRRLRRSPVFSGVALLTLTLGIGASASVFSLVNGVLIKPLPYPAADDLVFVFSDLTHIGVPRAAINGGHALRLQEQAETFVGFTHLDPAQGSLASPADEGARPVTIGFTGATLFEVLGIQPSLGRGFRVDEDGPGAPPVTVITDALWRGALSGSPEAVGSTIFLDGEPYQVIGVLPPDLDFSIHMSIGAPVTPDLFVPSLEDLTQYGPEHGFSFSLLGRIRAGAPHASAFEELDRLAGAYGSSDFDMDDFRFHTVYLGEDLVAEARPLLVLLLAAVTVLLLIVSSNLATLFLARGIARSRSTAVELALGAGRRRVLISTLAEPVLISAVGAVAGLVLAHLAIDLVRAIVPPETPRIADAGIDPIVVGVAVVAALLVGILTGLVPALAQSRLSMGEALRSGGAREGTGGRMLRSQRLLVGTQIALSSALLVSGALIGRSLVNLVNVDPGFRADGRLTFSVSLPGTRYDGAGVVAFYDELERRLDRESAVLSVARVRHLPLAGRAEQRQFSFASAPGATGDPEQDRVLVDRMAASAGLASVLELEMVAGRWFEPLDVESEARTLVIDQQLAQRFWPSGAAVGGQVQPASDTLPWTVIGVVRQPRLHDLREDGRAQVWVPHRAAAHSTMSVVVRTRTADPLEAIPVVRRVLGELDPMVALFDVRRGEDLVGNAVARWRFALLLMGLFGGAALLLAVLGVYGVVAYSVARRTREMGIRIALGAQRTNVAALVLRQGLRLVGLGLVAGVVLAWASGRLLSALMYQVRANDPVTVLAVGALILGTAVVAILVPARRASRVSPAHAFRAD